MRETKKRFLEILHVEMVDLKTDINWMMEESQRRLNDGLITQRVHLENISLFQNELLGVEEFIDLLLVTSPELFSTLDDMIDDMTSRFEKKIQSTGLAQAILIYAKRKIMKVKNYVLQPEP